ncbi:hypothetical protein J5TS2_11740 [Brevibacillus halotolerans]|nr:hypothetical protein J5TS2_11740 [Brevibacillus halotolerans]
MPCTNRITPIIDITAPIHAFVLTFSLRKKGVNIKMVIEIPAEIISACDALNVEKANTPRNP